MEDAISKTDTVSSLFSIGCKVRFIQQLIQTKLPGERELAVASRFVDEPHSPLNREDRCSHHPTHVKCVFEYSMSLTPLIAYLD